MSSKNPSGLSGSKQGQNQHGNGSGSPSEKKAKVLKVKVRIPIRRKPEEQVKVKAEPSAKANVNVEPSYSRSSSSSSSSKSELGTTLIGQKRPRCVTKSKPAQKTYLYSCKATEDHGQEIFGCQFNYQLKDGEPLIVATVGSNRVSIYECLPDGKLKILQVFADPDSEERYYCCAWTRDDCSNTSLLAVAGSRGVIRILSPAKATGTKHFLGHGNAVNDLVFHPRDPNLLLSASKDHSLRFWNIKTNFCVAIFGGVEGHRDEVISADIDVTGTRIVSGGLDHSLKVWKLNKHEIAKAVALSYSFNATSSRAFPTLKQNFPDFSTRDIHRNYVDCAKWFGDFILSKSCENVIKCWKGGRTSQTWDDVKLNDTFITSLYPLNIKDCGIWYMRFSMDFFKRKLALGTQNGKVYIYDLSVAEAGAKKGTILSHPDSESPIRQTAFSRDGKVLICVCDNSTIWRWDLQDDGDNNNN